MPEICRFYGIVVTMYDQDNRAPRFHARDAGAEVVVSIDDLRVVAGGLPARATPPRSDARPPSTLVVGTPR